MKHVYLAIFDLNLNKGGKTSALLSRAKIFNDNNIKTDIVTFDYKTNYNQIFKEIKNSEGIDESSNLYNQFQFFEKQSLNYTISSVDINKHYDDMIEHSLKIKTKENQYELFSYNDGKHLGRLQYKDNDYHILDQFENNYRIKRVYYIYNKVKRIKEFNYNNVLISEVFFNANGAPFLRRNMDSKTNKVLDIYLFKDQKHFNNNRELGTYFLERLIQDEKENIIICEGPGSLDKIINTNHSFIQKYAVMHTNHKNPNGDIKKKEENVLNNSNNLKGIIFLTKDQIDDVVKEYEVNNAYLINNFIMNIPDNYNQTTKKIVGSISRLSKNKGFDLFLEVAKKVIEKDHEIQFHIYGDGEYKETIKKLIRDKNLEDNIILFGYTNEVVKTLNDFKCVLSTSQSEAQGLSMIEAMSNGKPVISFDVKYGPSQFIFNNVNGFLIPNKDIDSMVEAILKIINDDNMAIEYGKNARNTILNDFNKNKILTKWLELFNKQL